MDKAFEYVEPTPAEQDDLKKYLETTKAFGGLVISIPYKFDVGTAHVAGVLYIRNPVEDSYTEGSVTGAVIQTYHLDKNKTDASAYDPSKSLLRVDLRLSFTNRNLSTRICNRELNILHGFRWKCYGWQVLSSW